MASTSTPGGNNIPPAASPSSQSHIRYQQRPRSSSVSSDRSRRRNHYSSSPSTSNRRHSQQQQQQQQHHQHHPRQSNSVKMQPMHDDSDAGRVIPVHQPSTAIDYLGNAWQSEDDIAASWKFMTKQKHDLINGLRLENASWRNWAKQRHHLKTVSPRSLNWLKDSDTTWLYGPLYKASIDAFDLARFGSSSETCASSSERSCVDSADGGFSSNCSSSDNLAKDGNQKTAGFMSKSGLKPALKHKTASELFKADTLFRVQSDLKLDRKIDSYCKSQQSAVFKEHRQPKLRFNDSVEQCISIDVDTISEEDEGDEDEEGGYYSHGHRINRRIQEDTQGEDDDEEEENALVMKISKRKPLKSIVRIHPTTLKAENMHGMYEIEDRPYDHGNNEDDEDDYNDSGDFDVDVFDEPIYLGNPYQESEYGYNGVSQQQQQHDKESEAEFGEVSYTGPTQPMAASSSSLSSSASISTTVPPSVSRSIEQDQGKQSQSNRSIENSRHAGSESSPETKTFGSGVQQSSPTEPNAHTEGSLDGRAGEDQANGGVGHRAANFVANVKDLVHWASSLVYNSSTF